MYTVVGLFPSPFSTVTIFAHALGVVRLVSMFTLRNLSLFVLNSSDDFRLLFCYNLLFLLEGPTLEVMYDHTFIYFEIELKGRLDFIGSILVYILYYWFAGGIIYELFYAIIHLFFNMIRLLILL